MHAAQPGILAPVPGHSRYMEFSLAPETDVAPALHNLASQNIGDDIVIGIGPGLAEKLGQPIAGLKPFPELSGPDCEAPSTQADLWVWIRGEDRGRIVHLARAYSRMVHPALRCERVIDGFKFDRGLDLTGYEDGTENPQGDAAVSAALVGDTGGGLDGSSYVAVQQWVHSLDRFEAMEQDEQDNVIGRRLSDNEELEEAPDSAHVKRTEQESFDPPAFVVRRSLPWADASREGLMFVAFGESLDAFEVQLRRMMGLEDGVTDALFTFTRPISGSYFWCPPTADGKLDLTAIGL